MSGTSSGRCPPPPTARSRRRRLVFRSPFEHDSPLLEVTREARLALRHQVREVVF